MKTTGLFLKACATILTLATASVSMGVEYTWDGGAGTANLLTANNWDTNAVPGAGDRMIWNGTTSGALNLTFNAAVGGGNGLALRLTGSQTDSLTIINNHASAMQNFRILNSASAFDMQSGAGAFTLGGTGKDIQLVLGGGAGSAYVFSNNSVNDATFGTNVKWATGAGAAASFSFTGDGNISVSGYLNYNTRALAITKSGAGTLTLSGNNTTTNLFTLSGGTLAMGHNNALGASEINIASGSAARQIRSADATSRTLANALTLGADVTLGAAGTGDLTFTGAVYAGSNTKTLTIDAITAEFTQPITGTGNRNKAGTGTLVYSVANTNTTGMTTLQEGTLRLKNKDALQQSTLTMAGGSLVFDSSVAGNAFTVGGLAAAAAGAGYNIALQNNAGTPAAVALTAGGNNAGTVYAGLLSGAGALVKTGTGSLTLSVSNTYAGGTTVEGGTLLVANTSGSATGAGSVTVNAAGMLAGTGTVSGAVSASAGATLAPGGSAAIGTLTLQSTLTLNGSRLVFDLPGSGTTNDMIAVGGALSLNGANTLTLNLLDGTLPAGTYTLMTYASTNGTGALSLDRNYRNVSLAVGETSVALTVVGSGVGIGNLTWLGDGINNPWDIGTSPLWDNGTGPDRYYEQDSVTFNDTGSASPDINLTTTVQPGSVTVNTTTKNYTLAGAGSLAGAMSLTKSGSGTLTLGTANTYSGSTSVGGGVLALSGGDNRLPAVTALRFTGTGTVDLGGNSQTLASLSMAAGVTATGLITNGTLAINGAVTVGAPNASTSNLMDLRKAAGLTVTAPAANLAVCGTDTSATGNSGGELYLPAAGAGLTLNQALVGRSAPSGGSKNTGKLHLGQTNAIQADQILVGGLRAEGTIDLQAGLTSPTVSLRNTNGPASRVSLVIVGENNAGSSTTGFGLVDFTGATLDARVGTLVVGRGWSALTAPLVTGTFKMSGGTLDVTDLFLCKNEAGGFNNNNATFTQAGGTVKAQTLTMGVSTASATNSAGSPVLMPTYSVGAGAALYAQTINSGTNAFGAASARTLNLSNGTLRNYDAATDLTVSGVPGLGGTLKLVLAAATTNTFYADAGRTNTVSATAVISGNGTLNKQGTGTLTLSGTNTYGGATLVSEGTLRLTQTQCLSTNTAVVIANGAVLNLDFEGTNTVRSLQVDWVRSRGVYSADRIPGRITGGGFLLTLEPPPPGTLIRIL